MTLTCAGCNTRPATTTHRRARQADHTNNILHLCPSCAVTAQTIVGQQLGWTVRPGNDPNRVPVFNKGTETWSRGGVVIPAGDAVEYMVLVSQIGSGLLELERRT